MKLSNYEAFILDLDGTLIDSGKYHAQAFADAVLELGGYSLESYERHEFFASHSKIYTLVLNERHGMQLDPDTVLDRKRKRMKEIYRTELFDGALAFLEFWKDRLPLALATNSPMSFTRPALDDLGLFDRFDAVITSDDVEHRKPDPEIIDLCARKLGVDPQKALVFEDQLIGIEAANRAGADVVAVDNGQPVEFPPDVPVHTWQRLLEFSA